MPHGPQPGLELPQIREPCFKDWDAMRGDDRTRFCEHCRRTVHNLEAYPEHEAAAILEAEASEPPCERVCATPGGRTRTSEYAVAERAGARRRVSLLDWMAAGVVTLIAAVIVIPAATPRRTMGATCGPAGGGVGLTAGPASLPSTIPADPADCGTVGIPPNPAK